MPKVGNAPCARFEHLEYRPAERAKIPELEMAKNNRICCGEDLRAAGGQSG